MKTTKYFSNKKISKESLKSIKGKGPGEDPILGGPIGFFNPLFGFLKK